LERKKGRIFKTHERRFDSEVAAVEEGGKSRRAVSFFEQNEQQVSRFWSGKWTIGGRTFVPSNKIVQH
jgi:hypothetical protein